ncbi:MAG: trigger factor, partial [Spirochaetota bacterium]|nr:trigger factor [Spirochaetota bacterium]
HIVTSPHIQELDSIFDKLTENKDFSFKAKIEVYPDVEIANYTGLTVKVDKYVYNEEHVNQKLKEMQYRMAEIEKKKNETIENGDGIKVQYNYYITNKSETANQIHHINLLEEDPWFEPIKNKLIGMKQGEESDLDITIPENHVNEEIRGKKGKVHIKILEVQSQNVPPIDDELAKDYDFETLDELKKDIDIKLKEACDKKRRENIFNSIFDEIAKSSKFSIGESFIESQIQRKIEQLEHQLKQVKVPFEKYLKAMNINMDKLKENFKEQVDKEVKFELMRSKIIDKENIEVTLEDLEPDFKNYAEYAKIPYEEAKDKLIQSKELDYLKMGRLYQKVVDFILENNKVKDGEEKSIYDINTKKLLSF